MIIIVVLKLETKDLMSGMTWELIIIAILYEILENFQ